jgi:uncharacterized repeat protein (TIGR01451 family)/fimbrial isopeptide formation D2 family protein
MTSLFRLKSKIVASLSGASAGKASLLLVALVAGGMLVVPRQQESARAVVCDNAPTVPTMNPYPLMYASQQEYCKDYAPLDARLVNGGSYSQNAQDLANGLNAQEGDEIYVLSYVHNGATNVGLPTSQTTARGVSITTNVPSSAGTTHVITTSFGGTNTNQKTGNFTIHTPAGMKLEVVPGSGQIRNHTADQILRQGFTMGAGAYQIGDLEACFDKSIFVRFTVKVVRVQQTITNNAICINNVVINPTPSTPGQPFTGNVTIRNTGNSTWNSNNFALGSQNPQGNTTWGQSWIPLPRSSIAPNEEMTVQIPTTAPSSAGTYNFAWQMAQNVNGSAVFFGPICQVIIIINNNQPQNTALSIVKEVRDVTASGSFAHNINSQNGNTLEYRIRIRNTGSVTAQNVIATDTFASGLTFVQGSTTVSVPSTGLLTQGGMSLGDLAAGQEITITYRATINQTSGTITNTATARANNASQVQDSAFVTVQFNQGNPGLDVNKEIRNLSGFGNGNFSDFTIARNGDTVEYRVRVRNTGNVTLNNVTLTDNGSGGTTAFTGVSVGGELQPGSLPNGITIGTLTVGQEVVVIYRATVTANFGTYTNTAIARAGNLSDSDQASFQVNNVVNPIRQLTITKLVRNTNAGGSFQSSTTARSGDRVDFQITVTNTGNETISNVRVDDVLPNGLSFVNNFDGNLGTMTAGQSRTITFQASVNSSGIATGTCLQNVAGAQGDQISRIQASATVCISDVLGGNINLQFSKKAWNDTKNADAQSVTASREDFITYTLTVTNTGNSAADNFVITDDLSGVLPFADLVDNGGGTINGNSISYPSVTVPAGGSVSKTFRVRVKASLQNNLTYVMRNTYGNTVTVNIGSVQGSSIFVARLPVLPAPLPRYSLVF